MPLSRATCALFVLVGALGGAGCAVGVTESDPTSKEAQSTTDDRLHGVNATLEVVQRSVSDEGAVELGTRKTHAFQYTARVDAPSRPRDGSRLRVAAFTSDAR